MGRTNPPPRRGQPLTPCEGAALALLPLGLTNREIARRLGRSQHTIANHLTSAYAKLGVQSRTAAALAVDRQQRSQP